MHYCFETQKVIQAIGVLLRNEHAQTASKLRILKLLYIADRESIKETGRPIIGSRVVAMDHGPLHSEVLNLINGQHIDEPDFSRNFQKVGYLIEQVKDPGVGRLSRYEIAKLQESSDRYASLGDWELAHEVTHEFEEWKRNYQQGTSMTICLEDIIDAVGRTAEKDSIIQNVVDETEFDELFESSSQ